MSRTRILFVDDEPALLNGIRNALHKERARWELVFAVGGDRALEEVRKAPFDIVVSDMRMPGLDGAALLGVIKAESPSTSRIVLSGHADRAAILRAMPVTQQFLSKPCDTSTLRATLTRTEQLRARLDNTAMRDAVGSIDKLPSVPRTYVELTALAGDATKGTADFAAVVERDPAMAAKVLQLVNSSYFGTAQRATSIRAAVAYLGLELLQGMVLTANLFAAAEARRLEGFPLDRIRDHSLMAAHLAKRFLATSVHAEEAFAAALLHDIGEVVIALRFPEELTELSRTARAQDTGSSRYLLEKEAWGFTHCEVGAYLLGLWGLPLSIVEAVAYHHAPFSVTEGPAEVLAAVHVADAVLAEGLARGDHEPYIDMDFLARAGLTAKLAGWFALAAEPVAPA